MTFDAGDDMKKMMMVTMMTLIMMMKIMTIAAYCGGHFKPGASAA